jgi:hypothetical protein
MADLNFQDFNPVQSNKQLNPPTIASAATIVPTHRMVFLTGTVSVVTITPPVTGHHELILVFTNASPGVFSAAGNIQIAYQPIQNRPIALQYDPASAKYWVNAVV